MDGVISASHGSCSMTVLRLEVIMVTNTYESWVLTPSNIFCNRITIKAVIGLAAYHGSERMNSIDWIRPSCTGRCVQATRRVRRD